MGVVRHVTFGRFRLDATGERLWDGSDAVPLRPKAFAVLYHLVTHPGELVTKEELLQAVWPATFVTDAVLKDTIRQLRDALGDDASAPQFIETAHRRGYRFIGLPEAPLSTAPLATLPPTQAVAIPTSGSHVLGRDADLEKLRHSLTRALHGERQVVFVTGEPGIGKTTLVNALVEQATSVPRLRVARGQCLEHYGAGEAYLPVLDGFSRLGRAPGGEPLIALLRQHAPAWLLELPSLLPAAERESLRQQVAGAGATRERMLREMAEAIEAITVEAPLILVLEDLHWSDYSTVDLIAYLARRRDPARLMVIGTYRPVEITLGEHPLKSVKRELQVHRLCHELPLEYLTEQAVAHYLSERLPGHPLPRRLARLIHRRTQGNPLFMVNVVSYLIDERVIVEHQGAWRLRNGLDAIESAVPESVKQLIERHIERLTPDERRVLEGASVVGMECSTVAIAAGLDEEISWVEAQCESLVRKHQFLAPARLVELPDGAITPRYRFIHVLYLEVPYSLLAPMQRAQIHGRIGRCGEVVYGDRVSEIAAELAMHFEQGRDRPRAVTYLLMAAENATHRSAHHEAAALARRGLRVLAELSDGLSGPLSGPLSDPLSGPAGRAPQEYRLRIMLALSLMATNGVASSELDETCRRALWASSARRSRSSIRPRRSTTPIGCASSRLLPVTIRKW
jgi:DNA-binding winged helix-turn-helix (wHTH) protein